ncbi:MAG: cysteine synthase A [Candidatus Omnitrophica bacterium]|nr:cysteine synthase A [Candidatus Omnitrophota bacterium]
MVRIFNDITQTVGNTPLVRLNRIVEGAYAAVLVKVESFNPVSSIKDRVGIALVEDARQRGVLKPGSVIIEPTSGNTGIALACAAAAKGYRLILTMPDTMSIERRQLLAAFGAEIVLTPGGEGMNGAIKTAESLAGSIPNAVMMRQFENPANPRIHRDTTGPEIWKDSGGRIDFLVAGVGTGGTITGAGSMLKKKKKSLKVIAVEPDACPVLSGGKSGPHHIQGIGAGFIPKALDRSIIDEVIRVKDGDAAETSRRLAKSEGILAGISGGAALWAGLQVAGRTENKGKTVVVILPDSGERYLSTGLFKD